MRFAIEGRIDNVGAADIFLFLSQTHRTSVVAFERPDQETRVFFVDGQPVWCVSSKGQLQIETRLTAGGTIKLRDIETALARQKAGPGRIPQALIAERIATEESIEKELSALALEGLRDVATWTHGTFVVFDGVVPPPWAYTITPNFPALLIEALRGQCQKEALHKEFIARKSVLRTRSLSRTSTVLSEAEKGILSLVNGERTVEDLIKASALDELATLGALHVLCALHLTDLLPPPRAAPSSTGRPTPELPVPAPPETTAPERGGATDRFQGPLPGPKPQPPALKVEGPPVPQGHSAESTAKLPALKGGIPAPGELPMAKTVRRALRLNGGEATEEIELVVGTFAIGRHPKNDLVLKDPRVSSFHCRLEMQGDDYVILDLKSRNGTLVNSARIERVVLRPNDKIQIGSTKLSYLES